MQHFITSAFSQIFHDQVSLKASNQKYILVNFLRTTLRQEGGGFMVSAAQEDIKTSKRFLAEPKLFLPSIIA